MIICLLGTVLLLASTVLGNDCSKLFTISPGNITRFTTSLSTLSPTADSPPIYCDYLIRAPSSSYYIELNFTELRLQNDAGRPPPSSSSSSSSDPGSPDAKSLSLSLQQQTSETVPPSGDRRDGRNKVLPMDSGSGSACLPTIAVVEVTADGREYVERELCLSRRDAVEMPTVFRSKSHILKIHYSWSPRQTVSFALTFVFHKWPSPCSAGQFTCDDGNCLPDTTLVCNNIVDCLDQSDERNCVVHSSRVDKQFTEVIVIVIVVVFTLGVIACVFVHYRLTTRMWRERQPDSSNSERHQLNPHTPQTTEVAYMPGMPLDHIEQEVALQRERQIRFHAVQTDMELNLPPAIRISKDGEEGYVRSQRLLQLSWTADRRRESICPPPNKTVFQGESPPPYRSHSVGKADGHCVGGRKAAGHGPGSGGHSPRISHCAGLPGGGDRRLYTTYTGGQHAKLAPCTPVAGVQPCCHHACHGSHGSQLPTSHLGSSPHSYGAGGGAGAPGAAPAAAPAHFVTSACPGGAATKSPYAHPPDTPVHNGVATAAGTHPGAATRGATNANGSCHNVLHHNKNANDRGYHGPPPDYTEVASPGITLTSKSAGSVQAVQSHSQL